MGDMGTAGMIGRFNWHLKTFLGVFSFVVNKWGLTNDGFNV